MKKYIIEPSFDNAKKALLNNTLGRNDFIKEFINVLINTDSCTSISLDGNWGSGKTFIVKQTMLCLLSLNTYITKDFYIDNKLTKTEIDNIKKLLNLSNIQKLCIPVYYDAWKNDNSNDPILSIVNEVIKSTTVVKNLQGDKQVLKGSKKIVKSLLSSVSAYSDMPLDSQAQYKARITISGKELSNIFDAFDDFKTEDYLSEFHKEEKITKKIIELFELLTLEKGDRIVFFIDELDRCKPTYAVQLLERIKHFFNDDRFIFVFSTNISELQNTIKTYYGQNFSATRYLDKFFDLHIQLPQIAINKFYTLLNRTDIFNNIDILETIWDNYSFGMREICRFLTIYDEICLPENELQAKYSLCHQAIWSGIEFIYYCFFPLLIALKMFDSSLYDEFKNGKNSTPLQDLFTDINNRYITFLNIHSMTGFIQDQQDVFIREVMSAVYSRIYNSDSYPDTQKFGATFAVNYFPHDVIHDINMRLSFLM